MFRFLAVALLLSGSALAGCPRIQMPLEFSNQVSCTTGPDVGRQDVIFLYTAISDVELHIPLQEVNACDSHPVYFLWEELDAEGKIVESHNAEWSMLARSGKSYQLRVVITETLCESVNLRFFVTPKVEW